MDALGLNGQQAGREVVVVDAVLLLAEPQIGEGDHLVEARPGAEAVGVGLGAHLLEQGGRLGGRAGAQQLFGQLDLLAELLHRIGWGRLTAQPVNPALTQIDVVRGVGPLGEGGELLGHALSAGGLIGIGRAAR